MTKKTFVKGAAILGVAGLLVQIMGAFFRIPLANIIGDDGMGYYQTAYPMYIFLLVFSTNGAPAAISKMVSERIAVGRHDEAHRVFKLSFGLMLALGIVASAVFFFGAEPIVRALKNPGAYYSMVAIAPALLFVPIMSVFRGYFQGMQQMEPTAFSQLGEQFVRVSCGLILAIYLLPKGLELAAAGASAGTSIGPVVGVIVIAVIYLKRKDDVMKGVKKAAAGAKEQGSSILLTLVKIAVPITIGVSILPITNMVDLLVLLRLQSVGFTEEAANALYGQLSGMAGPIINIPQALALAIALSIVPAVAAAKSAGDESFLKQNINLGLRTAVIIGVPCSFGLMILAEPIMRLLYPLKVESAESAAPCLLFMAAGIIFLTVGQSMAGILQGLGRPSYAVYSLVAAVVIKVPVLYILAGIPSLNVAGAAISSAVAFAAVGLLNLYVVKKMTGVKFGLMISVVKPVLCGICMGVVVMGCFFIFERFIGSSLSTVLSIGAGAAVYGITLIKSSAITPDEIRMLPKGAKLEKLLKKLRLIP